MKIILLIFHSSFSELSTNEDYSLLHHLQSGKYINIVTLFFVFLFNVNKTFIINH